MIPAGGFRTRHSDNPRDYCVTMNGAGLFNFTLERVPGLISDTLAQAQLAVEQVDQYIFHQSNQFMMKHLAKMRSARSAHADYSRSLRQYRRRLGALTLTQSPQCRARRAVKGYVARLWRRPPGAPLWWIFPPPRRYYTASLPSAW